MKVAQNHLLYKSMPEVIKISESIYQDTGYLKFLNHSLLYDNGRFYDLGTTKNWAKFFIKKFVTRKNVHKERMKTGFNYWKKNKNIEVSEAMEDARDNFDMDARIEFVYRNTHNKCFYTYSFYTNRANADKAYRFYDTHRDKLLKFIAYFNREAAHLIAEANKPENLIQIPDYNVDDIIDPKRNYAKELLEENKNTELTSKEFEIMLLHAYGLSPVQMGEVLCKNHRTIEWTLAKIYKKTGMRDRKSMQLYVRDNGWCGLEQFFFNYEGVSEVVC